MSDKTLRFIIAVVITILLMYQIATLISSVFGMAWATISSIVVAAVFFFSSRLAKAGVKSSLWFLLPTVIFTVIPVAMMIWNAVTDNTGWFERLLNLTPFMFSFGAPIVLLSLVYYELRKRSRDE